MILLAVSEFAKKTGDYRSLSLTDLKVIALVYDLEKENVGTEHLKSAPEKNVSWQSTKSVLVKPTDIAGFYLSAKVSVFSIFYGIVIGEFILVTEK